MTRFSNFSQLFSQMVINYHIDIGISFVDAMQFLVIFFCSSLIIDKQIVLPSMVDCLVVSIFRQIEQISQQLSSIIGLQQPVSISTIALSYP